MTIDIVVKTSLSLVLLFVERRGNSQKLREPRRKNKDKDERNHCKLGKYFLRVGYIREN